RRTRCQCNVVGRPREARDQGPRRWRGQVRYRPASQALPAQWSRRYRPDHGQAGQDRALRATVEGGPRLGVIREQVDASTAEVINRVSGRLLQAASTWVT